MATSITVTWLLLAAAPAHATVTYAYTGNQLTQCLSHEGCGLVTGLTLEIRLNGPLAANFSGDVSAEVYANGWTFTGLGDTYERRSS